MALWHVQIVVSLYFSHSTSDTLHAHDNVGCLLSWISMQGIETDSIPLHCRIGIRVQVCLFTFKWCIHCRMGHPYIHIVGVWLPRGCFIRLILHMVYNCFILAIVYTVGLGFKLVDWSVNDICMACLLPFLDINHHSWWVILADLDLGGRWDIIRLNIFVLWWLDNDLTRLSLIQ